MEELKQAILEQGIGIGNDIVKVDGFLNHRIDTALMTKIGRYIAEQFKDEKIDLIMTVEASGIAVALAAAQAMDDLPVVFAKKGDHINVGHDVYIAEVYSFTHRKLNTVRVSRKYLDKGMRVLLVDDFLANGGAIIGMREILRQAECELVGAVVCVEKGFQEGGRKLREEGVRLLSLAIVDSIDNGVITLRDE